MLTALLLYWIVLEEFTLMPLLLHPFGGRLRNRLLAAIFGGERWKKISHSMITKPFSSIFLDNV